MSAQVLVRKLNQELTELKADVREMKRFIFAPLKDSEGEYRESFVKKMLARAQKQGPFYKFTSRENFLKHVRAAK